MIGLPESYRDGSISSLVVLCATSSRASLLPAACRNDPPHQPQDVCSVADWDDGTTHLFGGKISCIHDCSFVYWEEDESDLEKLDQFQVEIGD